MMRFVAELQPWQRVDALRFPEGARLP